MAFFLPIGLAVSIFCIKSAPRHNVLIYMVIPAAVALVITAGVF
jgi:hypothetical protein